MERAAIVSVLSLSTTSVLRVEVEVIQEIPDVATRGPGVTCGKCGDIVGNSVSGAVDTSNKSARVARLGRETTYTRGAERAGTTAEAARTRMANCDA